MDEDQRWGMTIATCAFNECCLHAAVGTCSIDCCAARCMQRHQARECCNCQRWQL